MSSFKLIGPAKGDSNHGRISENPLLGLIIVQGVSRKVYIIISKVMRNEETEAS